jgi:hypothetical protein
VGGIEQKQGKPPKETRKEERWRRFGGFKDRVTHSADAALWIFSFKSFPVED